MGTIGTAAYILQCKLAVDSLSENEKPLVRAHKIRHLGDAYYYAGQLPLAEPCYVEALAIYREHERGQSLDLANAIRSFAVLKQEVGATDEAQSLWQEAHDLYAALKVHAGVAESAARLALLAYQQGDLEQSRARLGEAVRAADQADDPETQQYIRKVRAEIEN